MEVHLPTTVGSTFMRQYYHLLAKEPASLHRFYKDESTWCHGVGSHMQDAISGQKAINDEILRRGYAGARVDLDIGSIDCQASLDGGVLVLVTGVMTLASSAVPKPFVQTFFLAVQPKGYFVLNDCLRFLELPGAAPAANTDAAVAPTDAKKQAAIGTPVADASPAPKSKPATPTVKKTPASPAAKPVETPVSPVKKAVSPVKTPVASPKAAPVAKTVETPASPVKKAAPADKVATPTPKPSETKPATPASPTAAPTKAPAAPASPAQAKPAPVAAAAPVKPAEPVAPAAPPAPKTWAALFSGATAATVATVAALKPAPAAPKPTPASPAKAPADAPAKPAEAPVVAAAPQEKEKEKKRLYSLYIRDVPAETKESDLRELFKSYGAIASVGIPANRGIAFVDYRDEASMRAALADDKEFKVHDKVIHVEERKDKERSGFRADSRGGRGGRGAPKSGRSGERKDRDDGKERRADNGNGKAPASSNGPRAANASGDRRDKGGRRSGKEDGGRGAKD